MDDTIPLNTNPPTLHRLIPDYIPIPPPPDFGLSTPSTLHYTGDDNLEYPDPVDDAQPIENDAASLPHTVILRTASPSQAAHIHLSLVLGVWWMNPSATTPPPI